jgi:hypothetical protein
MKHARNYIPTIADHHVGLNGWIASKITSMVGTMWCAYLFAGIALISLPSVLKTGDPVAIVAWVAQTFLQLVLLSVIMVGQKVQGDAADARSIATFHDTEVILDRLNVQTEGGIKAVYDKLTDLEAKINNPEDRKVG